MRHLLAMTALAALVGCGNGENLEGDVDPNLDSDGDGLTDLEEAELGTDPYESDSDFDGFDDLAELEAGTDPTEFSDHPYYGGYPKDDCADSIVATGGYQVGDIPEDFELFTQFGNGEKLRLYDFCDQTVLLVSSAFG